MPTETLKLSTDVLVVGAGLAGLAAADEIARQGYGVILAAKAAEIAPAGCSSPEEAALAKLVKANSAITVMNGATLADAAGLTGNFSVRLSQGGKIVEKKVGAIVIATDFDRKSLESVYGLSLSDKVISQSKLEALLCDKAEQKKVFKGETDVAFLVGYGQDGNALVMERVLCSLKALKEIEGVNAYVFVGDMKLAADGLDRLYGQARRSGVLYFKSYDKPKLEAAGDAVKICFRENVLRRDAELDADLVVVEEALAADSENEALAKILRLDRDETGFFQLENVHSFPVRSNREGIFVVGSARDYVNMPDGWTDAANAALAVKKLLGDGTKAIPSSYAVVDTDRCTICLTCYRACPHGAIYWDSRAIVSLAACQACGICASECPMEAIQVTDYSDRAIAEQIALAGSKKNGTPLIVAFACRNSAFEAEKMAKAFELPLPEGLSMVKVPCAGKIDIDYILDAFVNGADGVMVATCHTGNCKAERGNTYAAWRVSDAARRLEAVGLDPARLAFTTFASNMGVDFSKAAMELEDKIKAMP